MGGFSINTNITSLQAREYLRTNSDFQSKTISRVTSGLRITASGDDAAGLAIANGFRSDISVLSQGIRNANDGLSQLQIVDGGLNNVSKLIDRARTLATQSATGTFTGSRAVLNSEFGSVLKEIDRQAQAIGLNIGGSFAKNLSVFIGGGGGSTSAAQIQNGSVSVDLSSSSVDTRSLGLSGVQASGVTGTDISSSSTTSVANIIADSTNSGDASTAGFTDFYFRGAGFSDTNRVKVSVNLSGVTNSSNLADAINAAIDGAGNGGSQAATAFKNAGVRAVVIQDKQGDGTVKERLGFTSSNAAFQVEAGDRTANALLGNFSTGAVGKDQTNVFVGGTAAAAAGTTAATAGNIIVRVQGGGLDSPVDLRLSVTGGTTTVGQVLADFTSQISNNSALQAAGIEVVSANAGEQIVLQNKQGERFEVLTAGDTSDILGLGSYRLANQSTATSLDYTSITGTGGTFTAVANRFEISVNGSQSVIDTGSFTPAPPPSAMTPQSCAALVKSDAAKAEAEAAKWRAAGGGIPARACLGMAQVGQEHFIQAAGTFETAARDAQIADSREAIILWMQAGNAALLADEAVRARTSFDRVLEMTGMSDEGKGEVYLDRARANVAAKDLNAARVDLDQATKLVPRDPLGWLLSANLARKQGDLPMAFTAIREAARLAPTDAAVAYEAGNIAAASGQIEDAKAAWTRAAQADPTGDAGQATALALKDADKAKP